jgi:protein gp37
LDAPQIQTEGTTYFSGARLEAMGVEKYQELTRRSGGRSVWTGKIRLDESSLDKPRTWPKPRRIFVNSMSDLFHEAVPADFVARVWQVMRETPRHTYQILTKRPARMATMTCGSWIRSLARARGSL